jgi:preprotein translocase subunit SecG
MELFTTTSHIILCVFLILIILLQPGKDSADIFGGGQGGNRMYGNRSNSNPLNTATTLVAVMFMVTSITLALYSTQNSSNSNIVDNIKELEEEFSNEYFKLDIPKISVLTSDLMKIKVPSNPFPEIQENEEIQENDKDDTETTEQEESPKDSENPPSKTE